MKGKQNLKKIIDDKQSILKEIITLLILKNLNNSRKFDDLSNQEEIFKELETLIKYIDFRLIKAQILTNIIEPLNEYCSYYNIITYY